MLLDIFYGTLGLTILTVILFSVGIGFGLIFNDHWVAGPILLLIAYAMLSTVVSVFINYS